MVIFVCGGIAALGLIFAGYLWSTYATQIDARLGGEQRAIPRIFGRPFELRPNQALTPAQLEQRLNDVGYASRTVAEKPGEFSIGSSVVVLRTRDGEPITARVEFSKGKMPVIAKLINQETGRAIPRLTLEAPMLTAIEIAKNLAGLASVWVNTSEYRL